MTTIPTRERAIEVAKDALPGLSIGTGADRIIDALLEARLLPPSVFEATENGYWDAKRECITSAVLAPGPVLRGEVPSTKWYHRPRTLYPDQAVGDWVEGRVKR